jgi:hypothetical protein
MDTRTPLTLVPTPAPVVEPLGDGTAPGEHECLPCYVARMLAREGCDHSLRWAMRWRDGRAPRARALDRRLEDRGGFCDCEVLLNVYPDHFPQSATPAPCAGRVGGRATDPCRPPVRARWW